ncbi:sigma-E processing peptidase SpoIIGA [Sediminibacillus albus]|uniref:sigma-E processing peptidase SpoIIGA n=1 Tax=Sediminibacillus albus TaxID=407036 RepID=UPI000B878CC4|nr:sigma-E processing peptidase SpoIIGA [Sediminibacillus albus]
MTIYLDAVWLLNFLLDWMILLLTQFITRSHPKRLRILFGAFMASLLVPLTVYFPDSPVSSFWGKGIYSLIIVWSAFGYSHFKEFRRHLLSFYFISFTLGGSLIGIHFLIGQQILASESGILTTQTGFGDQISWLFVAIGFPFVWIFTKTRMDKHAWEKLQIDQLFSVTIKWKGESFLTTGYMDSGNALVDPITRDPVVVCDVEFLENWFTTTELKALEAVQENLAFDSLPSSCIDAIRLVPYQGVSGNNSFMLVFRPDNIHLVYENKHITTNKVLVGIQFGSLAADGSYHCLLHQGLLKYSVASSA